VGDTELALVATETQHLDRLDAVCESCVVRRLRTYARVRAIEEMRAGPRNQRNVRVKRQSFSPTMTILFDQSSLLRIRASCAALIGGYSGAVMGWRRRYLGSLRREPAATAEEQSVAI
jgi:hypothetical protein